MRIRIFINCILLLLPIYEVNAKIDIQENVKNFTLDLAIKTAFDNSHDLTKVKLDKLKSDYQVTEAWGSAIFPKISGQVDYRRAIEKSVIVIETPFFSGQFPAGTDNTITSSINLSQPLLSGSAFFAVRIAENYAAINDLAVSDFKSKLIYNVKQAFYGVLIAKEVYNLTLLNKKRAEDNYHDTEIMYKQGLVSDYDAIRAKVQSDNLTPIVIQTENTLRIAKNHLKLLMGLDVKEEIDIEGNLQDADSGSYVLDNTIEDALKSNSLLQQLELQHNFKKILSD